jgi:hypothetical protein
VRGQKTKFGTAACKNAKPKADGYTFDSEAECRRYAELSLLERAGHIHLLEVHPRYVICPETVVFGKKSRARVYIADFAYIDSRTNRWTVEDVKGFETETFVLKRHLFLHTYPEAMFVQLRWRKGRWETRIHNG